MGKIRARKDKFWIWFLLITGVGIVLFTVLTINADPKAPTAGNEAGRELMSKTEFLPPVLKSFIINPESKTNYFDFVLGVGNSGLEDKETLKLVAEELINYFFLGITLPSEDFWVNLNPVELSKITSPRLVYTDMGKVLLETDLRLKKDAALLTDPRIPAGKLYWSIVNQKLQENNLSNYQIPANTRLWIIPEEAVLEEEGAKARLISAKLKVCLESEYFQAREADDNSTVFASRKAEEQKIQDIASSAMKEAIVPVIEYRVNNNKDYAKLRQIYRSLILAEYFKHNYWGKQSLYESHINTCSLTGLEAKAPWSKKAIFDSYVKSINRGEYSFYQQEYDPYQLGMTKKHYFSGGMEFACLTRGFNSSPIVLQDVSSSPVLAEEEWLVNATTDEVNPLQLRGVEVKKVTAQRFFSSPIEITIKLGSQTHEIPVLFEGDAQKLISRHTLEKELRAVHEYYDYGQEIEGYLFSDLFLKYAGDTGDWDNYLNFVEKGILQNKEPDSKEVIITTQVLQFHAKVLAAAISLIKQGKTKIVDYPRDSKPPTYWSRISDVWLWNEEDRQKYEKTADIFLTAVKKELEENVIDSTEHTTKQILRIAGVIDTDNSVGLQLVEIGPDTKENEAEEVASPDLRNVHLGKHLWASSALTQEQRDTVSRKSGSPIATQQVDKVAGIDLRKITFKVIFYEK
jgi:hypothetical protein